MSYEGRIVFFCVGDGSKTVRRFGINPWKLLQEERRWAVMLALADGPLPLEDLKSKTSMEEPMLHKKLNALIKYGLVRRIGDEYATCIPVISDQKANQLKEMLIGLSKATADVVGRNIPDLIEAYSKTEVSKEFRWSQVAHIIIDALLMDFSFLSCLHHVRIRERLFKGWSRDQLLIPFFGMEVGVNQVNLGVNSSSLDGFGVSILHGSFINRPLAIFRKLMATDELRESVSLICAKGSANKVPEELIRLGLIKHDDVFTLAVPLLRDSDKEILTPPVLTAAHKVAEELVMRHGFHDVLSGAFSKLGYSRWISHTGDFDEIVAHYVMALTVEELIRRGRIPKIPEKPPLNWGIWLWEKPWTLSFQAIYKHRIWEVRKIVERLGEAEGVKSLLEEADKLFKAGRYRGAFNRLDEVTDKYKEV